MALHVVFAGKLSEGLCAGAILDELAAENLVIKMMADGVSADRIPLSDTKGMEGDMQVCEPENAEALALFGSIGNGLNAYGPFESHEVAREFSELNAGNSPWEIFTITPAAFTVGQ